MSSAADGTRGLRSDDSTRSTYQQIGTLIEHLTEQHGRLRDVYRAREERPDAGGEAQRTDLVYGYLARREAEFGDYLKRFSDSERQAILETWLQYADTAAYDREVEAMIDSPPADAGEAVARATAIDRELAGLYERLEESAEVPAARTFFGDLRETMEQRAQEHAEQLQQVQDL